MKPPDDDDESSPSTCDTAVAMAGLLVEQTQRLGLSQRQFADLVGSTTKHVNVVFNGKATAHPSTLDQWAGALGLRFAVVLTNNNVPGQHT